MLRTHTLSNRKLAEGGLDALRRPEGKETAWVEVVAPTPEELAALRGVFGLHELALEDALRPGHPPKLEDFDDHLFVIAHTPAETRDHRRTRKIAIFLSRAWVVTILREPLDRARDIAERARRNPAHYLASPALLAHALLDGMTDAFESEIEELQERARDLEEEIEEKDLMERIVDLRRHTAELQRIVRGQRDVCASLARSAHAAVPKRLAPYVRDVYDHLLRVHDLLESVRDALGLARDAHLAAVNNRLSEIMRVLTVIATVMMPLSLVAGVFGMNFARIPGSDSAAGFWVTVGGMATLAAGMLWWFRRRDWL